jgi:hypothetical protein
LLVKKQHLPNKTLASKRCRLVEDYSQLNTAIFDEIFVPLFVQGLIDIIGNTIKYCSLIGLKQGYLHIPLKVSDLEKTTFSTG